MKFRTSFQVSREPRKENGPKPTDESNPMTGPKSENEGNRTGAPIPASEPTHLDGTKAINEPLPPENGSFSGEARYGVEPKVLGLRLRQSKDVLRKNSAQNGVEPKSLGLRERQSKVALGNTVDQSGQNGESKSFGLREQRSRAPLGNPVEQNGQNGGDARPITPKSKALRDIWNKTGASIRAKSARLERSITRKKSHSKVVKPLSKRNSQIQPRKMDIDDDVLDKIMGGKEEKRATGTFYEKQRMKASFRRESVGIEAEPTQEELDKKPLSADQVQAMFKGAPCFSVEEQDGRYKPHVIFKGSNAETAARFPKDYDTFGHPSFAACTLNMPKGQNSAGEWAGGGDDHESSDPIGDLSEVPNMLSMQGIDRGAVGYEHFLQLPISDSLVLTNMPFEKRRCLLSDPSELGLQVLDLENLITRLAELSEQHAGSKTGAEIESWNDIKLEEMGEDLFKKLLSTDRDATAIEAGSKSLEAQTSALEQILNKSNLWYDFSLAEWRMRLGQLLWSPEEIQQNPEEEQQQPNERDVLLLQITLAAELLLRRRISKSRSEPRSPILSVMDADDDMADELTPKVQWDLLLAEKFLDNVNISIKKPSENDKKANRLSLLSAVTFFTARETSDGAEQSMQPIITPRNEAEQLAGLVQFAEAIQWPHANEVAKGLSSKFDQGSKERSPRPISTVISEYATPLSSPRFPTTPGTRTSFFGFSKEQTKPGLSRTTTAQSIQLFPTRNTGAGEPSFDMDGWLSCSWLSGLVMPGESACHFLMSALLENSPQAITALGQEANLYGGFIYEGRSYWSKHCLVGRVLGAAKAARECMGWVSIDGGAQEQEDGWINLDVKEMLDAKSKPRIKDPEAIAKDSDLLHNQSVASAQVGNFTRPDDGPEVAGNELKYHGLSFSTAQDDKPAEEVKAESQIDSSSRSIACLTFSSPNNSAIGTVEVPLIHDAYFVSSYPCHPKTMKARSRAQSKLHSRSPTVSLGSEEDQGSKSGNETPRPTTASNDNKSSGKTLPEMKHPSKQPSTSNLSFFSAMDKELPLPPTHPLHIDYHWDIVPAATLLGLPTGSRPRALSSPQERQAEENTAEKDVVVLDCRGSEDLELFARAWCAKVGENAVIGKTGRTCLACCVREARALGICIVIRI